MTPETKKSLLYCATLCAVAGIRGGERILQICAEDPEASDSLAETQLHRVEFAAEILADERFAKGGDHESASIARSACFRAANASFGRRLGIPLRCEHCPDEGDCNVCGRAA